MAYQAIEIGETMPAVMEAANEIAVNAFLEGSLKFTEIPLFLQRVMGEHGVKPVHTVEDTLNPPRLDLSRTEALNFSQPDPERFPCLYIEGRSLGQREVEGHIRKG